MSSEEDPPPPYPYPSAPPLERSPRLCRCRVQESGKHESTCPKFPVPCPNGCNRIEERRWLETHRSVCPLEPVACEMKEFGCSVVVPRKELATHMRESELQHLTAMTALNLRLTRQLQQDTAERDRKMEQLHREIADQKEEIKKLQNLLQPQQPRRKQPSNLAVNIRGIPEGSTRLGHSEFSMTQQNYEYFKICGGEMESQDYLVGKLDYTFKVMIRYNTFLKAIGVFVSLKETKAELPVAAEIECKLVNMGKSGRDSVRNVHIMWTRECIGKYGVVDSTFMKYAELEKGYLANNCLNFHFSVSLFAVTEADVQVSYRNI